MLKHHTQVEENNREMIRHENNNNNAIFPIKHVSNVTNVSQNRNDKYG